MDENKTLFGSFLLGSLAATLIMMMLLLLALPFIAALTYPFHPNAFQQLKGFFVSWEWMKFLLGGWVLLFTFLGIIPTIAKKI